MDPLLVFWSEGGGPSCLKCGRPVRYAVFGVHQENFCWPGDVMQPVRGAVCFDRLGRARSCLRLMQRVRAALLPPSGRVRVCAGAEGPPNVRLGQAGRV